MFTTTTSKKIKSNLLFIVLSLLLPTFLVAQTYVPPIGIPAPEFGIEETHTMYANAQYDFGSGLEAYKDAGNGPYTHYVDKTDPNATDTNNPYGTPEKPRLTIPQNIAAGSVVEIHNGQYSMGGATLSEKGTASKPIFFRGISKTNRFEVTSNVWVRSTSYVIIENVYFNKAQLTISQVTDHFCLRHSEVTNESPDNTGLYLWTNKDDYTPGELKEHLVIYDNEIHDNGLYPATDETGDFGIMLDNASQNVWIIDNHIYENGDDGIQIIERNWVPVFDNKYQADRIFIGRNKMHHDGENAIDVKGATNIIISQNEIYGYSTIFSSSAGEAIRINDEKGDYQNNIWVIYNRIYDSVDGIDPAQAIFKPYVIGNIIYNCSGYAINQDATVVTNNTIYNCGTGVGRRASPDYELSNNIITNSNNPYNFCSSCGTDVIYNNILYNNNTSRTCSNCIDGDPKFVSAVSANFYLQSGSPAISGSGTISSAYETFKTTYGIDINVDFDGNPRPQDVAWAIGAYEYDSAKAVVPTKFTLTVNTTGKGTVDLSPSGGIYDSAMVVTLTAVPNDGEQFEGWSGDLSGTANPAEIEMTKDMTVTAAFTAVAKKKFTLTVNTTGNGSVNLTPSGGTYDSATVITLTAVPNDGEQFEGWSGDLSGTANPAEIKMTKDMTVAVAFTGHEIHKLPVSSVKASEEPEAADGNTADKTIDNDLGTYWTSKNDAWIQYDLGSVKTISHVGIIWHRGDERTSSFEILITSDTTGQWAEVFKGQSSGTTEEEEDEYDFPDMEGKYVRISCHGNSNNEWNSIREVSIYGKDNITSVEETIGNTIPTEFSLSNYPNPFNPSTTIKYTLPISGNVQLIIYDALGRKVKDLYSGHNTAGVYELTWNADNNNGRLLASGVYFLSINTKDYHETIKLLYLR